jgi:hypothetical protein
VAICYRVYNLKCHTSVSFPLSVWFWRWLRNRADWSADWLIWLASRCFRSFLRLLFLLAPHNFLSNISCPSISGQKGISQTRLQNPSFKWNHLVHWSLQLAMSVKVSRLNWDLWGPSHETRASRYWTFQVGVEGTSMWFYIKPSTSYEKQNCITVPTRSSSSHMTTVHISGLYLYIPFQYYTLTCQILQIIFWVWGSRVKYWLHFSLLVGCCVPYPAIPSCWGQIVKIFTQQLV